MDTLAVQSRPRRAAVNLALRNNHYIWPPLAYLLLSLLMTWPLVTQLGAAIPSDTGSDMLVHEWTLWWLKHALLNLQNPFFTDLLAHPTGVALTSHNIAWMNFALWFPLACAFGQAAATSLSYILIFTFNGYVMYLFAYDQTRSRAGGWVAGLIFGFFPATLSDAGHTNMLITGWLPLALLYLGRVIKDGGRRNVFLAGLFLALLGITRWQLLAIAVPLIGLFVLWRLASSRRYRRLRTLGDLAAAGAVPLLVMAPFLLPLLVAELSRTSVGDLLLYEPAFSADLLGYVAPDFRLSLWQWLTPHLPAGWQFAQQEIAFLGYTALLLALFALVWRWRASLVWLLMAAVLIVLALGPVVTVGQQKIEWLYTPYRLIEDTFFNQLIRKPWRYNAFLGLPLAMLGAIGIAALRSAGRRWAGLLAAVASLLILAEYWIAPMPTIATAITPAWYQQLAEDPDDFAILGLPISSRWADKFFMYYQMQHGKPMVGGHVSRPPAESIAYMAGSPFLNDMLYMREMDPAVVDVTHQLRYLADANVRYVILHKNFVSGEKIEAWKDWLSFAPVYEDDTTIVYRSAPVAGMDFTVERQLTNVLGVIRTAYEPAQVQGGEPLSVDLRWGAAAAVGEDYGYYCINLVAADGALAQQECQPISPDWPTSLWQADEVARSAHAFRVDPFLTPGSYTVVLALRNTATGSEEGDSVPIGSVQVDGLPRTFALPDPQHAVAARFGEDIQLHGYDLEVRDGSVALTLYWQTDRRLDRSYKVFVHAIDTATGALVAQYDAAPRNWAYPTTWWEAEEVVADPIELPIELPPAGGAETGVQLLVGLYDEATGERLPLTQTPPGSAGDVITIEMP